MCKCGGDARSLCIKSALILSFVTGWWGAGAGECVAERKGWKQEKKKKKREDVAPLVSTPGENEKDVSKVARWWRIEEGSHTVKKHTCRQMPHSVDIHN